MTFKLTETIDTVSWPEGISKAPAELATKAKLMADEGRPATFGKVSGTENWVVLSVNEANQLYVALRS